MPLYDMHCHLDFFADPRCVGEQTRRKSIDCFSVTVSPDCYKRAVHLFEADKHIGVGLGFHPWWIADGRLGDEDIFAFESSVQEAVFVGEVGLDFGKRCEGSEAVQRAALDRVLRACAHSEVQLISLHAVKAEDAVLELLDSCGCLEKIACVFHWFSGSSDQLLRAIDAGCYFSVGPQMIASKRGREYVKAIPPNKLLIETDTPSMPGSAIAFEDYERILRETYDRLEAILGKDIEQLIEQTSRTLLGGRE